MLPGMDDPDALLPVESAGNVAGISPRTLRYWIRGGKLPATEGQRGKLVRLGDVLALAEMTGKLPATGRQTAGNDAAGNDPARSAGNDPGNAANLPPLPAVADNMRAALEVFRDELVRPFVDDLREAERKIGRLEAERDALWSRLEQIEAEQAAAVAANQAPGRAQAGEMTEDALQPESSLLGRLLRWIRGA